VAHGGGDLGSGGITRYVFKSLIYGDVNYTKFFNLVMLINSIL
jgi:hypothetical protein